MCFVLWKDIFNYKDICCFLFFNNSSIFFIINVYSSNNQLALKYLKNTEVNIQNILIIASNFDIRDNNWDLSYSFYSSHSDTLLEIVDLFDLSLFLPIQPVLTWYPDNNNNSSSVTDLFFLWSSSIKLNNYNIFSKLWFPSNHALLTIDMIINDEFIQKTYYYEE